MHVFTENIKCAPSCVLVLCRKIKRIKFLNFTCQQTVKLVYSKTIIISVESVTTMSVRLSVRTSLPLINSRFQPFLINFRLLADICYSGTGHSRIEETFKGLENRAWNTEILRTCCHLLFSDVYAGNSKLECSFRRWPCHDGHVTLFISYNWRTARTQSCRTRSLCQEMPCHPGSLHAGISSTTKSSTHC